MESLLREYVRSVVSELESSEEHETDDVDEMSSAGAAIGTMAPPTRTTKKHVKK